VKFYAILANTLFIIMVIVFQFIFKNLVDSEGVCDFFHHGKTRELAQRLTHIGCFYILMNECTTLYLFVYPLWCMYKDYSKKFLIKQKDLNIIWNLATSSIVLSIPVPVFQSVYIIIGTMTADLTWATDRPYIVFLYTGFFQYLSMSWKYRYCRYIFFPFN